MMNNLVDTTRLEEALGRVSQEITGSTIAASDTLPSDSTDTAAVGTSLEYARADHSHRSQYVCNPNLLDNGYFIDPINQRGKSEYVVDSLSGTAQQAYIIDRWYISCNLTKVTASLVDDGLKIAIEGDPANEATSRTEFIQKLDMDLRGKRVVVSAMIDNVAYTLVSGVVPTDGTTVGAAVSDGKSWYNTFVGWNVYEKVTQVVIWMVQNSDRTIQGLKLELGDRQSIAHYDPEGYWVLNEIPNKALELAKCQRYQVVLLRGGYSLPLCWNTNDIRYLITLPVPMRSLPTITSGIFYVGNGTGIMTTFDTLFTCTAVGIRGNILEINANHNSYTITPGRLTVEENAILDSNL